MGNLFSTSDESETKVKAYERAHFVPFWERDAATNTEAAKKRLNKFLKPDLKYYELKYCCIHGGQAFKVKGKEDQGVPRKLIEIISDLCRLA